MSMRFYNDEWETFIEHCGFTDDELEVIAYLRRGWYAVDIAAEINTCQRTVERRKRSIRNKIARYLIREG